LNRLAATVTPERPILFSVLISSGYVIAYLIQSWPQPLRFWSHSWLDDGDGLVMVWNAWLARQQGLNFVWTDYLFAPDGIPLLVHTYVPLKGWIGALLPVPVIPAVNLLVLGSFALAGTWTFWVARRFSPSTWSCLLAGWAFTFTGFHWAHAQGHLNLLSTELLPLFALVWLRFEERPNWTRAAVAAAVLWATALTDYYFAIYCVMLAAIFAIGKLMHWQDLARFAALALPTTGALAWFVWRVSVVEDLLGAHDATRAGLDPVSLVVYGGHSRFAELTRGIWERIPGPTSEHSLHLGIVLWIAIIWKARCRRWWTVFGVFLVLALGARLTVLGYTAPVPLPYAFLEWAVPPLGLGGVPVRMAVMVALAASILFAMALPRFRGNALPVALALVIELLPGSRPATRLETPGWVEVLATQDGSGALYDPYTNSRVAMHYQTLHGHPISGGWVARVPARALARNDELFELFKGASPDPLVQAGFEYILIRDYAIGGATLLWEQGEERLYRMVPTDRP
jgi:hypothetical protein